MADPVNELDKEFFEKLREEFGVAATEVAEAAAAVQSNSKEALYGYLDDLTNPPINKSLVSLLRWAITRIYGQRKSSEKGNEDSFIEYLCQFDINGGIYDHLLEAHTYWVDQICACVWKAQGRGL